ncbi:hypothetical protein [Ralstonia solanacearum]|uniref:Transmembrane protein n=1 Tax=Ralstonia solanacearum TaxID=305 RepID=A0AAE3NHQ5_RALSL|nr:hypothetical protein [Ralstonia solanacearum]MBB6582832.1 hypothetical protein [Ralstonia solanacearum]MDB0522475.1 hypothetical protein [Ralstonia solanacearum]
MSYQGDVTVGNIAGNGNVVGHNNRFTVNNTYIGRGSGNGGGNGKNCGDGGDGINLLGVGVLAIVVIVGLCYYFARNAEAVYLALRMASAVFGLLAMVSTIAFASTGRYSVAIRCTAVALAAMAAVSFIGTALENYPVEITNLANQADIKTFWCSLLPYGRQLALLHLASAGLGFGLGLMVLAGAAILPLLIFAMHYVGASSERLERTATRLTSIGVLLLGCALIGLACYAHTQDGLAQWLGMTAKLSLGWPICAR